MANSAPSPLVLGSPGSGGDGAGEKQGVSLNAPLPTEATRAASGALDSRPENGETGAGTHTGGSAPAGASRASRASAAAGESSLAPRESPEDRVLLPSSESSSASHCRLALESGESPTSGRRGPGDAAQVPATAGAPEADLSGRCLETASDSALCGLSVARSSGESGHGGYFVNREGPRERQGGGASEDAKREDAASTAVGGRGPREGAADGKREAGLNAVERTELCLNVMKTNVFVFQIPLSWTEDDLHQQFSEWGTITSVRVERKGDGRNRGYGFVCFSDAESAQRAVESMDGRVIEGKQLKVSLKKPRQQERHEERVPVVHAVQGASGAVKTRSGEEGRDEHGDPLPETRSTEQEKGRRTGAGPTGAVKCSLFVFHVPPLWGDEQLLKHFELYGRCASAVVVRRRDGTSKGYGFVDFEDAESALCALQQANQAHVDGKRLKVLLKTESKKRPPYAHASADRAQGARKSGLPSAALQSRERCGLGDVSKKNRRGADEDTERLGNLAACGRERGGGEEDKSGDDARAARSFRGAAFHRGELESAEKGARGEGRALQLGNCDSPEAPMGACGQDRERRSHDARALGHRQPTSLSRDRGPAGEVETRERVQSAGGRGAGAVRADAGGDSARGRSPDRAEESFQTGVACLDQAIDGDGECPDGTASGDARAPTPAGADLAEDGVLPAGEAANGPSERRGLQRPGNAPGHARRRDKLAGAARYGRPDCTVFVFHVPPEWSDWDLRRHFRHLGRIRAATIQRDKDDGQSRGFGFITFGSPAAALSAVAGMNGFHTGNKYLKVMLKSTDRGDGKGEEGGDREEREKREKKRGEEQGRGTGPSAADGGRRGPSQRGDRGEQGDWHGSSVGPASRGHHGGPSGSACRGGHPTRDRPEGRRGPRGISSCPLSGKALQLASEPPRASLLLAALPVPAESTEWPDQADEGACSHTQRPSQRSAAAGGCRGEATDERVSMPLTSPLEPSFSSAPYAASPGALGHAQSPAQTTPAGLCGDRNQGLLCGGVPHVFPLLPVGDGRGTTLGGKAGVGPHSHVRQSARVSAGSAVSGLHSQPLPRPQTWLSGAPPPPPHHQPMSAGKTGFLPQATSGCFASPPFVSEGLPTPYGHDPSSLSSLCLHHAPMSHDCGPVASSVGYHESVNEGMRLPPEIAMGAGGQARGHPSSHAPFFPSPFPSSSPAFVHTARSETGSRSGNPRARQGPESPVPAGPEGRGDEATGGGRPVRSQNPAY
ncbi:putative RNA recognition motif-containing protein [Neospora caninum Liverpool]|uniref:Putative RNA recognition motif-containing protein n=1 Tax=Neospora caninum (strain Liverpool) TaxID=572307 RepID=F0VA57_NEOCL|nr:putative RNA recognition motif-containing protein [Neospora caninum Liverpool]CBZ50546.1 putative RNA recognition motif-containing protein [Neospora caninum Liverpool]CEL65156.1 TPA: RNA recognition motif-containing protein,putative [Neospora caninum Liverpool]|eukprot:XP_003880579.1 putative RNA recognition motif-containing protein [Neospora caninum Liverpool]